MSCLGAFFKGWSFRTNKPSFEAGQEIAAVVTGYDADEDVTLVRVGDTVSRTDRTTSSTRGFVFGLRSSTRTSISVVPPFSNGSVKERTDGTSFSRRSRQVGTV